MNNSWDVRPRVEGKEFRINLVQTLGAQLQTLSTQLQTLSAQLQTLSAQLQTLSAQLKKSLFTGEKNVINFLEELQNILIDKLFVFYLHKGDSICRDVRS